MTLNNGWFARPGATLESVADRLKRALDQAHYADPRFFCVRNGFVIATRLERIHGDKTPFGGDARWQVERIPLLSLSDGLSLSRILGTLVNADPGRYRMIVFYVTDQPVVATDAAPGGNYGAVMMNAGTDELPDAVGAQRYTSAHRVRVFVYEFARPSVAAPPGVVGATLPAKTHLERAGLWQRLQQ
jgi:hypothetical protein